LDPDLAVYDFRTTKLELGLIGENFVMINYGITFYALFGLILVSIGIYSLIARTVHQRTREIGIRMALGAKIGQVVELVAFRGFSLALAGSGIGSVAGLAVTRILSKIFVGFPDVSWLWFISASVGLLVFAWVACLFPARHAARVDPMVALRSE
jgi:ABC-type antimicrobial peptide transport system permease subunit